MAGKAAVGLVILGVGFMFIGLGAFGGFSFGGEDKVEGRTYCDVSVTLTGLVRDYNPPVGLPSVKDVINWDLNFGTKAGTCEVYEGGLFSVVGSNGGSAVPAALIGEGSVQITIAAYNDADEVEGTHTFTVTTPSGVAEKTFVEVWTIRDLEDNAQYSFKVTHPWNSNQVSYTENYTV